MVKTFIDFMYQELDRDTIEYIANIPPGLKVLRNSKNVNLFDHPHIILWHKFLLEYFDPYLCNKHYAIIMPCSSVKPYRISATHRILDSIISRNFAESQVQIYVLSEPMILVPRELDIYYPFANYDYPIDELTPKYREKFINILSLVLPKLKYHRKIVAVLPKHHLSILLESLKRADADLDIEIFEYGRKAFHSIKMAVMTILKSIS